MGTKRCSICRETKPHCEFHKNRSRPDGITAWCKACSSWGNRGDWHIDHIIPLASANSEEEILALCHYTNLQPLWAEKNIAKSDKVDFELCGVPSESQ